MNEQTFAQPLVENEEKNSQHETKRDSSKNRKITR